MSCALKFCGITPPVSVPVSMVSAAALTPGSCATCLATLPESNLPPLVNKSFSVGVLKAVEVPLKSRIFSDSDSGGAVSRDGAATCLAMMGGGVNLCKSIFGGVNGAGASSGIPADSPETGWAGTEFSGPGVSGARAAGVSSAVLPAGCVVAPASGCEACGNGWHCTAGGSGLSATSRAGGAGGISGSFDSTGFSSATTSAVITDAGPFWADGASAGLISAVSVIWRGQLQH